MDNPLSEEEEDYLDLLLGDPINEDDEDIPYVDLPGNNIGDSEASSQSTSGSQDPLARPDIYWKDQTDEDTECLDSRSVPFRPKRQPGLQLGSNITRQTSEGFRKPQLVLSICIATNQYAASLIAKGQNLSYVNPDGTWTPVTVDEMYRFIGIIFYMSFIQLPSTDKYWSTSPLYKSCNSIIASTMTLKRFKAILSFIQINGDPDKDEKLTRIQPLIDHIQTTSQLYFHPFETISVDERMVASKHKFSGIRQFVKEKPIRFGIKLWVLADTVTGYTYSFFVYLGKKRTYLINKSKGLSYNVVMELTKPLFNQGYRLYTDCFYTSLHLANDLLQNHTYLIGAIKANSTAMPICLKGDVHLFNKFATKGDFRWHRESTFVFVQWKDCRTITFMSPIHKGSSVSDCMRTLEYRECLVMSLLDVNTCSKDKTLNKNCIPGILDNRKDCSFCSASSRMQGLKYLSVKTTYYCSSCKVPLCYTKDRNCFQRWHSDEGTVNKKYHMNNLKNLSRSEE
ncbi:hypothetical protein KUTeg_005147 [Tegillarca granosa]|uniref:PiggyBac transposable element-derived protein domain-containing protein n=1 Tax=Tegillarca granosa TaxID=220873 RepID=A0ABQ9FIX2_TEGGR|nr:hypothetical protein KUTeg_005147 [Tegillarca granosa]